MWGLLHQSGYYHCKGWIKLLGEIWRGITEFKFYSYADRYICYATNPLCLIGQGFGILTVKFLLMMNSSVVSVVLFPIWGIQPFLILYLNKIGRKHIYENFLSIFFHQELFLNKIKEKRNLIFAPRNIYRIKIIILNKAKTKYYQTRFYECNLSNNFTYLSKNFFIKIYSQKSIPYFLFVLMLSSLDFPSLDKAKHEGNFERIFWFYIKNNNAN